MVHCGCCSGCFFARFPEPRSQAVARAGWPPQPRSPRLSRRITRNGV